MLCTCTLVCCKPYERILYCKGHHTLLENMHLNEIRVFDLVWLWQLTFWSCFWYATLWGRSPWARFCNFCWDPSQRESTCNFLLSLHQGLTLAQFWIRKYHAAAESLKLKIFFHPNESIFKRICMWTVCCNYICQWYKLCIVSLDEKNPLWKPSIRFYIGGLPWHQQNFLSSSLGSPSSSSLSCTPLGVPWTWSPLPSCAARTQTREFKRYNLSGTFILLFHK